MNQDEQSINTTNDAGEEGKPPPSTLAIGEEEQSETSDARDYTTHAIGEEDPRITTQAIGEEGDEPTTLMLGEEDDKPTTQAVGEEDDRPTTLALGEEEPREESAGGGGESVSGTPFGGF
ncbi:MAG: hypothetical protein M3384_08715 [Acidobacteriota bacterium]|nr:hypothetical protein [Acidobacteriota bacterium]